MKNREAVKPRELIQFLTKINSLEPAELAGVFKILKVSLKDADGALRSYEELLSETIDVYCGVGKKQRKELNKVIDAVVNRKNNNGNSNKDMQQMRRQL